MKTKFLILMGVAYTMLFWHGQVGVNVFLFDGLLLVGLLRLRPELARQPTFRWAVAMLLPAALSIVLVHGVGSQVAHHLSFLLLIGFVQARELRFIWFALLLGVYALVKAPIVLLGEVSSRLPDHPAGRSAGGWLRQLGGPVLIVIPFFLLYLVGSAAFNRTMDWVGEGLEALFRIGHFPYAAMLFGMALILVFPLFGMRYTGRLNEIAGKFTDRMTRRRSQDRTRIFMVLGLRNELRRGVLTVGLLNVLLLVMNLTDVVDVWLSPMDRDAAELSRFVHEGTYSLIASIVLAALVVLYFFRGNLNFFGPGRLLRKLTITWLAQNAFLALSVGVRNWHYVREYGLAYGRVHVAFVLLLILIGLFTLYRKVRGRLSLSYLLQANGLSIWLLLVAYGAVNWPGVITRYNLNYPAERVDWDYLVRGLDDRNLFLLRTRGDELPARSLWYLREKESGSRGFSDLRSWNFPDYRNERNRLSAGKQGGK
jgi:hypothetical protein